MSLHKSKRFDPRYAVTAAGVAVVYFGAAKFAAFPFIMWAAVRFGQREAASAAFLISGFAVWGAINDRGPFATGSLDERLILLDVFVAATVTTALTLGAVTSERKQAEQEGLPATLEVSDDGVGMPRRASQTA